MRRGDVRAPPRGAAWLAVAAACLVVGALLVVPAVAIFSVAFSRGAAAFARAISHPDTLAALRLTAAVTAIAVPLNTVVGVAIAWAIARRTFRGKALLVALVDVPFAVSPVVAGMLLVVLFGARGPLGGWLVDHGLRVVFTPLGITLATVFVTSPFVARELAPVLVAVGTAEETAARALGAGPLETFWRVTLPNVRWGLLHGVIVCTARAVGEFGAVSVVSGHVRGRTNTVPLHVEVLYNDYDQTGAFAVASLLAAVGLFGLAAKKLAERRAEEALA